MTLEVCRRHRRTPVFEIFRRPAHNAVVVDQLAHDQSRVLRWTDPNDDIYSLFNEVHHPIGQHEVDRDFRMRANEVATHWTDMCAAECHRRAHTQKPLRFYAATRQYSFGVVDLRQDALGSFIKILPFFCQRKAAGAARNEARLGSALELRETLADHAESEAHLPAGRGQASRSDNADKCTYLGNVVQHARPSILSIRWRVSPSKLG